MLSPLVLITFLIKLSKYPQNTNTVVAEFDIVLHRLTANAFFRFLVILDRNFKGKKPNSYMVWYWKWTNLWQDHLLTLFWFWSAVVRCWRAEQLLAQAAHLHAAKTAFPPCESCMQLCSARAPLLHHHRLSDPSALNTERVWRGGWELTHYIPAWKVGWMLHNCRCCFVGGILVELLGEHGDWFLKSDVKSFRPPLEPLADIKVQLRRLWMNWSPHQDEHLA